MKQSDFDNQMKELFEISNKKYSIDKKIESLIELDSLNILKLLTFLSENKKNISNEKIKKFKKFVDIYKFIEN
tara:strand:- start:1400 stop:1618 length:219 start_codon:yes stop_codon:yes gene_type:complete